MKFEFDAVLVDGRIDVPAEFAGKLTGRVHVVLRQVASPPEQLSAIAELLDNPIHLPGFERMTREEANERRSRQ
jgi:hypothetical protein